MGHSTIQMTYDVYGHLFADAEADQKSAEDIQARLLGDSRNTIATRGCKSLHIVISVTDFDSEGREFESLRARQLN